MIRPAPPEAEKAQMPDFSRETPPAYNVGVLPEDVKKRSTITDGMDPPESVRKRVVVETSPTAEDVAVEMGVLEQVGGTDQQQAAVEDSGRERLKRHRTEMAGRVWIPDIWGQESLLKDWKDCSAIDRSLFPNGLLSAREALVEECRRANSGRVRISNSC